DHPTVKELIDYEQFCGVKPETAQTTKENALQNGIPQMSVKELKERRDAGEDVFVLDVREPYEYQICNLGGTLIPQNDVPQRLAELDREREIVVQCRTGGRSQRIAEFLQQAGYAKVKNLAGGIQAWATEIDPSMPKY
ncbi:MAG: rhodanese-like domain-containing protein, partial [Terriglobales bacterium]